MDKLRFLIITFDPPENVGGVEGRARAYTSELIKKGNFVVLASFSKKVSFKSENFCGAKMSVYPSQTRQVLKVLRKVAKEISSNRIENLFFLSGALTLFGVLLLLYGRIICLKTGIFLYGKDILETSRKPFDKVALFCSQLLAKRTMVNSNFTRSLLSKAFQGKIRVLYPGIDPYIDNSRQEIDRSDEKRILFVGRLVKRKGVDDLLAAFKQLLVELPNIVLEIVGDGPDLSRLKKLTIEMDLSKNVKFYGNLRGEALYERYRKSDVFAMPSRRTKTDVEGFGTVFLEAGLFGKPSVGTRSGGIPEAVLDNDTGLLVPEGDVNALKESMSKILKDRDLGNKMGERARERVLSNFTWEDSTDSLLEAFSTI